jgi:PAS domain S-box-containing protein
MLDSADQRIKYILTCSPAIVYACRLNEPFSLTFISENFSSRFGHSINDCLNNPDFWRENIHPDDYACVVADYASLYEEGHHIREYRFWEKAGGYQWVLDERRLIYDSDGFPVEIIGSWLDITDRKVMESALRGSETLFRDFFHANPIPTIISDSSGVVHMVNPAFTVNPGFPAEEVVGRTVSELGFWRIPADRERMVAAIKSQGFIDNLESSFYGKGNKPMTCLISSRAVELEGELRILSTVLDVTEQRKAEEALRKLDQAKSDFISTAAHELRTPLIAIVGYSELLENVADNTLTDEQKSSYLSIIQNNAQVLQRLVNDLLDVGRIQIGRPLGVVLKEHRLSTMIAKVAESFRVESRRHKILVVHCDTLPETILIDGARITQVLNNLLSNAIKYSPQGGEIKIQTMADEETVTVSIIDQGIGMTPQQIDNIFDRFYRGVDTNYAASGLGLGMSIVKQIITDHGGEVFVSSSRGEGTTIAFSLPKKQAPPLFS